MSYQHPVSEITSSIGQRQKIIARNLYEAINEQACSEQSLGQPQADYLSTSHHDYCKTTKGIFSCNPALDIV